MQSLVVKLLCDMNQTAMHQVLLSQDIIREEESLRPEAGACLYLQLSGIYHF